MWFLSSGSDLSTLSPFPEEPLVPGEPVQLAASPGPALRMGTQQAGRGLPRAQFQGSACTFGSEYLLYSFIFKILRRTCCVLGSIWGSADINMNKASAPEADFLGLET